MRDVGDVDADAVARRGPLGLDGVVEVLGRFAVDGHDAAVAEVAPAPQVLGADFLGVPFGLFDHRLGKAGRQIVRTQDDLDVDARLAQEPEPLLDLAVGDAARIRERRQPDLNDLALAGASGFPVRDPDHGVDLRIVGQDHLPALLRLEAADHALANALQDAHDHSRAPRRASPAIRCRPRALFPGEDRVAVEGAVHPRPRNEEVLALVGEHESEALGPDGQAARHEVRELDRRVLLAPDSDDLAPPLEQVELLAEGLLLGLTHAQALHQIPKREGPGAFLTEAFEDLGVARQHAAESIRRPDTGRGRPAQGFGGSIGVKRLGQSSRFSGSGALTFRSQPQEWQRTTPFSATEDGLCGSSQYGLGQFHGRFGTDIFVSLNCKFYAGSPPTAGAPREDRRGDARTAPERRARPPAPLRGRETRPR